MFSPVRIEDRIPARQGSAAAFRQTLKAGQVRWTSRPVPGSAGGNETRRPRPDTKQNRPNRLTFAPVTRQSTRNGCLIS